jgi:putative serine protease PepD
VPAGLPSAPVEPVPARSTGRLRIGMAGLVAGALIGGGAGAGVVTLFDEPSSNGSTAPTAQSVVIQDPQTATTATAAAAKAAPSVVTVYVQNGSSSGSGSGVVLTPDGYVLTNNHVVTLETSEVGEVQVRTADGTLYDAEVVGTDPSSDLAVIKLDGADGLTPADFADSDKVQVGDVAVAIGAPLGLSNTVTDGIISATDRAVATGSSQDDTTVIDALQTDAAINPGNSGGPLVNLDGRLVGMNTATASDLQSQGYAIGVDRIKTILATLKGGKSIGWTGLGFDFPEASSLRNQGLPEGLIISNVVPGTPAVKAGLGNSRLLVSGIAGKSLDVTLQGYCDAVKDVASGKSAVFEIRDASNTVQRVSVRFA